MRRLWGCAAVLALLFAASLWNSHLLTRTTDALALSLSRAQSLAEQEEWDLAREATEAAQAQWRAHQGYLYTVLRHSDADEVEVGFDEVLELLNWREYAEYTSVNTRLIANIRLLAEMDQLTLLNLL